jgi:hypothetical protein
MATVEKFVVSGSGRATITKDPNATLDYTFDWTAWLAPLEGDTIIAAELLADPALTITAQSIVGGNKVIAYISGGTAGELHQVTCRITTLGGRIDDRSFYLRMLDK